MVVLRLVVFQAREDALSSLGKLLVGGQQNGALGKVLPEAVMRAHNSDGSQSPSESWVEAPPEHRLCPGTVEPRKGHKWLSGYVGQKEREKSTAALQLGCPPATAAGSRGLCAMTLLPNLFVALHDAILSLLAEQGWTRSGSSSRRRGCAGACAPLCSRPSAILWPEGERLRGRQLCPRQASGSSLGLQRSGVRRAGSATPGHVPRAAVAAVLRGKVPSGCWCL